MGATPRQRLALRRYTRRQFVGEIGVHAGLAAVVSSCGPQDRAPSPSTLSPGLRLQDRPAVETFAVTSARLREPIQISVARLPGSGGDTAGKVVVLYLLDPAFNFFTTVSIASFLSGFARIAGGRWPPVVIAGVGYQTDDPREVMTRRARDLTPTSAAPPPVVPLPPLSFGGASEFLAALQQDVCPTVEKHIQADASSRVLVGHSFGGLCGLYSLFHRPETFDGYIVISPSLWWDDRVVLRYEQAWSETHLSLPARLFLAVGGGEQAEGAGWLNEGFSDEAIRHVRQVGNFRELEATLARRHYQRFHFNAAIIAGEYHLTVFPAAFGRGLRWIVDQMPG
jgi:uncharacterized protein